MGNRKSVSDPDLVIARKVAEWDEAGKVLHPAWITTEIVNDYDDCFARGDRPEYARRHMFKSVRKDVGQFITKNFGKEAEVDGQHVLPGCEFVQRRYVVDRNGDDVAVLIEDMTEEEAEAKAQELEKRGRSCIAHADELRRVHPRLKVSAVA